MIDIRTLAALLLIGQLVSVTFIILVLIKQYKLLKLPVEPPSKEINNFRKLFFILSVIIFFGNLNPIAINIVTIFVDTARPDHVAAISVSYAVSVSLTAAISSMTIWLLYRTALSKDHNNN